MRLTLQSFTDQVLLFLLFQWWKLDAMRLLHLRQVIIPQCQTSALISSCGIARHQDRGLEHLIMMNTIRGKWKALLFPFHPLYFNHARLWNLRVLSGYNFAGNYTNFGKFRGASSIFVRFLLVVDQCPSRRLSVFLDIARTIRNPHST